MLILRLHWAIVIYLVQAVYRTIALSHRYIFSTGGSSYDYIELSLYYWNRRFILRLHWTIVILLEHAVDLTNALSCLITCISIAGSLSYNYIELSLYIWWRRFILPMNWAIEIHVHQLQEVYLTITLSYRYIFGEGGSYQCIELFKYMYIKFRKFILRLH